MKGVRDLQLEQQINVPEIRIKVNREEAGRLGLTPGDVLETAQIAFNGEVVSQIVEGQRFFPLFLWFDEASRRDRVGMGNLLIDAADKRKVPLRTVAEVSDLLYLAQDGLDLTAQPTKRREVGAVDLVICACYPRS